MTRESNTQYILSLSYGKDSLACLGAIDKLRWPLDRIVHAEVWATNTIPADFPSMVEFKKKADAIIKERWGIEVEHVRSEVTFEEGFYFVRGRTGKKTKFFGKQYGWPMLRGQWCLQQLKLPALNKICGNGIEYIGIAIDEPNRFHNLTDAKKSPLVKAGWTEAMCREWCEQNDLLSPIYTTATRGGCWFCHNQSVNQLRLLRQNYPEYWTLMLKWDSDSPVTFKPDGHTIHDYDLRFSLEDEGKVPKDRKFRWEMLNKNKQGAGLIAHNKHHKEEHEVMEKNYKDMNVLQKLTEARLQFLDSKVDKTGKNMHLEFKYFELEDIVPVAIRIFAGIGLTTFTCFDGETAAMTVLNADNPDENGVKFAVPYRENKPIISNQGKEVTNPMQALGASITYLRRYLWMMVLDITEPDDVDANLGADGSRERNTSAPAPKPKEKPKAPATQAERKAAKKEMTATDGPADEMQITALKTACKKLMETDETQEEFVQQIAIKTKGFTEITRSACEQLVILVGEMIAACSKEG